MPANSEILAQHAKSLSAICHKADTILPAKAPAAVPILLGNRAPNAKTGWKPISSRS
jgi:hypothetical protein